MTIEQYEQLLAYQGGVCYLCQKPGVRKFLAVDHDHKIAKEQCDHPANESCQRCWRGLIHGYENSMLALARDSVEFFKRCISYLEKPPAQTIKWDPPGS
jgi:hypothetical protein